MPIALDPVRFLLLIIAIGLLVRFIHWFFDKMD